MTGSVAAAERGWFRPEEAALLRRRYAIYLTARNALHGVIHECRPRTWWVLHEAGDPRRTEGALATGGGAVERGVPGEHAIPVGRDLPGERDIPGVHGGLVEHAIPGDVPDPFMVRFAIAWTGACMLVRAARELVETFGVHPVVRRKLDEPSAELRIPRGCYRRIRRSLTHPLNAWRLAAGLRLADQQRDRLNAALALPELSPVAGFLAGAEPATRLSARRYVLSRLRYRGWSVARRGRSALRQGLFSAMRTSGSLVADLAVPGRRRPLRADVRREVIDALEPGDVLVTRHEAAVSNFFLPGTWPHAALHLGPREWLEEAKGDAAIPPGPHLRWREPNRVLEARKDGVRLRALDDTLSVDAVVVLRPHLGADERADGLVRALAHEGKPYNFDFDFFNDDRLVCTEVVFRAYDGLGSLRFRLTERFGRPTLSAEDLVTAAVREAGFDLVLVAGSVVRGGGVQTGDAAIRRVRATLLDRGRSDAAAGVDVAWPAGDEEA
ncbi:MAG: YiiX/YebB-like N1pC/P60 family cysteine hydrolase [Phycisphaerales bacterium]